MIFFSIPPSHLRPHSSPRLPARKSLLWSAKREVSFHPQCCHCLFSGCPRPHQNSQIVSLCVFMLLLHFLPLSIFILFQSFFFSPKYLSPPPSLRFPSFSSHSSSPQNKTPIPFGCHGNWLPCSSEVFTWSLHVCVSTVAWQSLGVMLIGNWERGSAMQRPRTPDPCTNVQIHTAVYRKLLIIYFSPRPDQLTYTSCVCVCVSKATWRHVHTLLHHFTVSQWGFVCNYRLRVGL